jgi:N-acetylglucosaminyldiphosphoundecaprenol N-acetyl-beta-D-mannosaminyltransferase
MRQARIFGFVPSALSAGEIAALVRAEPPGMAPGPRLIVTANIDHIASLRRDAAFAAAYANAAIVTCDGFPVLRYAQLRGCPARERVTGCDIAADLLTHRPPGPEHRLFFVADAPQTAGLLLLWAAAHGLSGRTEVAVAPPDFRKRPGAQLDLARRIRAHGTTILFLGIGAPRSEVFVHAHRVLLPPCWALCVGQALRIEMGLVPRAPAPWQRANLEWLWRLVLEPRRLLRRYVGATLGFLAAVAGELARGAPLRLMLAAVLAGLVGCTQPAPVTHVPAQLQDAVVPYRLHPGDELEILFTQTPELNQRQTIRDDGRLPMPLVGDVPAAGLTVPQFHDALAQRYAAQLVRPDISVVLRTASANRVFVGGEVVVPGAEALDAPLTASRAIILAQGLKPTANEHQVLVIHSLGDGTATARTVDIGAVFAGDPNAADVALQPFDVVFVPDAPIARVDRFVDQYIRQLLPTTPTVLYQINPSATYKP